MKKFMIIWVVALVTLATLVSGLAIFTNAADINEDYIVPPTSIEVEVEVEDAVAPSMPIEQEEMVIPTEPEPEPVEPEPEPEPEFVSSAIWYSDYRVYATGEITTKAGGVDIDIEFLAKLLNCEARGMDWEGKVYTCSAILNFCDRYNIDVWRAGHTKNCFSVAPYVDDAKPTQAEYEVIEYVLSGGRIGEICHFRSGGAYHDFGTPICQVGAHYFSIN